METLRKHRLRKGNVGRSKGAHGAHTSRPMAVPEKEAGPCIPWCHTLLNHQITKPLQAVEASPRPNRSRRANFLLALRRDTHFSKLFSGCRRQDWHRCITLSSAGSDLKSLCSAGWPSENGTGWAGEGAAARLLRTQVPLRGRRRLLHKMGNEITGWLRERLRQPH